MITTDNTNMDDTNPIKPCDIFIDFVTQLLTGHIMVLRFMNQKDGKDRNDEIENYNNIILSLIYKYLNNSWMSILKNDDEYITDVFNKLSHHSPICIFHLINNIILEIIPKENMKINLESGGFTDESVKEIERAYINSLFKNKLISIKDYIKNGFAHNCSNTTIPELRDEWEAGGKLDDELFKIGILEE